MSFVSRNRRWACVAGLSLALSFACYAPQVARADDVAARGEVVASASTASEGLTQESDAKSATEVIGGASNRESQTEARAERSTPLREGVQQNSVSCLRLVNRDGSEVHAISCITSPDTLFVNSDIGVRFAFALEGEGGAQVEVELPARLAPKFNHGKRIKAVADTARVPGQPQEFIFELRPDNAELLTVSKDDLTFYVDGRRIENDKIRYSNMDDSVTPLVDYITFERPLTAILKISGAQTSVVASSDNASPANTILNASNRLESAAWMKAFSNLDSAVLDKLTLTLVASADGKDVVLSKSEVGSKLRTLSGIELSKPESSADWLFNPDALSVASLDEGTYLVTATLSLDSPNYYGFSGAQLSETACVSALDKSAPAVGGSENTLKVQSAGRANPDDDGVASATLITLNNQVSVEIGDKISGVNDASVRLSFMTAGGVKKEVQGVRESPESDTFDFDLENGYYAISDMSVSAVDNVGNEMAPTPLSVSDDGVPITHLLVDHQDHEGIRPISIGLSTPKDKLKTIGSAFATNEGRTTPIIATAHIKSFSYGLMGKSIWRQSPITLTPAHGDAVSKEIGTFPAPEKGFDVSSVFSLPKKNESVLEGRYTMTARMGLGVWSEKEDLIVDYSAPTIEGAAVSSSSKVDTVRADYEDHSELAGEDLILAFDVNDGNAGQTAGVKSVRLSIPHSDALDATESGRVIEASGDAVVSKEGRYEFRLSDRGTYFLDEAAVTTEDLLGNVERYSFAEYADLINRNSQSPKNLTRLHVTAASEVPPTPVIKVVDIDDEYPAATPGYHREAVNVRVYSEDPLIDFYKHVNGLNEEFLTYTITDAQGISSAKSFSLAEFERQPDGSYSLDIGSKNERPKEGVYDLEVRYSWLGSQDVVAKDRFVCDYTAPQIGALDVSEIGLTRYGVLISPSEETLMMKVSDNLPGVEDCEVSLEAVGPSNWTNDAAMHGDLLTFTLPSDGQRLDLASSKVRVRDKAGNESETITLADAAADPGSNVPKGTSVIVVDTEAPTIGITYDNNDVRNGRYYAAPRVATLHIKERVFDILKENEPNTSVATISVDGSKVELRARDFDSLDGVTWTAQYNCANDGDWNLAASLTDLVGRRSNQPQDEFTVDTTAPLMRVEFDNNDVRNGMHFNSPRYATVSIVERNFSAESASATASAKDASGASAGAPAASAWTAGESNLWTSGIAFAEELHYDLSVNCTDLAGNTAETLVVPEFVVDMTAPTVEISGVDNNRAYSGSVSLSAKASDINYDLSRSSVQLTGARRGDVKWANGLNVDVSPTGESLILSDFERIPEDDDVYVLVADAVDLAGNRASETRRFSVNRFGSTYYFSELTSKINGSYLQHPEEVVVTEVNASGLDTTKTHVELTRGTEINQLLAGSDYQLQESEDRGWSATTYRIPAATFAKDGYYRLSFTSTDLAGNLSQNTMPDKNAGRDASASLAFAVDGTNPTGAIAGVDSGKVYFGGDRETTLYASDNLELDSASLFMDGEQVRSWDAAELSTGQVEWSLAADARPHDLTLQVRDRAGNVSTASVEGIVAATNYLEYLKATPAALFRVIVVGICSVGGIGVLIWALVRRRHSSESRRNPFSH